MKYQIKLLISILTIGILFTGCARRSYDTSDQLVLGISENLPLYLSLIHISEPTRPY